MVTVPPLLAIDPGREKCGLAVVNLRREVLERDIISTDTLTLRIAHCIGKYDIHTIVIGDRTGAREARDRIRAAGLQLEIVFVDEDRSSELGRHRYLLAHKPRGWARLLPIGLRSPDAPYDDFVAIILAERYLDGSRSTRIRPGRGKM